MGYLCRSARRARPVVPDELVVPDEIGPPAAGHPCGTPVSGRATPRRSQATTAECPAAGFLRVWVVRGRALAEGATRNGGASERALGPTVPSGRPFPIRSADPSRMAASSERAPEPPEPNPLTNVRWRAVEASADRSAVGLFFDAVRSTGVYRQPGCGARRPLRRNVALFPNRDDVAERPRRLSALP
jgi:hypothetical protein